MRESHRLVAIVALHMVFGILRLWGQDIRLSPNVSGYRMLPQARIQAADSANGDIAVVWGTTESSSATDLWVALYAQIIRGGVPLGSPIRIGMKDSRISGAPRVVAMGKRFLILYCDAKVNRAGGTYCQMLDPATLTLSEPHGISTALLVTETERTETFATGDAAHGWRIFWFDRTQNLEGMYSCHFDSLGTPTETAAVAASYSSKILSYTLLPDLKLILDPVKRARIFYASTGEFERRPLPHIAGAFQLAADTSLVMLVDSTISVYHSIFDSLPIARTFPFSQLKIPVAPTLVSRNFAGNVAVYFPRIRDNGLNTYNNALYSLLRFGLDPSLDHGRFDTLFTDSVVSTTGIRILPFAPASSGGCDNRWEIELPFGFDSRHIISHPYFLLGGDGEIHRSETPDSGGCDARPAITLARRDFDSATGVAIRLEHTVMLRVPVARPSIPRHLSPAVIAYPDRIICSWQELNPANINVLGTWMIPADTIGSRNEHSPPAIPNDGLNFSLTVLQSERVNSDSVIRLSGDCALQFNYHFQALVRGREGNRNPVEFTSRLSSAMHSVARPSITGWKTVNEFATSLQYDEPPFLEYAAEEHVMGYDPADRDIVTLILFGRFYYLEYENANLHGYRGDGTGWDIGYPGDNYHLPTLIPMGTARYILVDGARARYFNGPRPIDTFALPVQGESDVRFFKLRGPWFAMTSWSVDDPLRFNTRLFDTLGRQLRSVSVRRAEYSNDYVLVTADSDSRIAVLFGGNHGLRATLLTNDLHVIAADTLLSATVARISDPAGAFRNDTLFAAWVDYRDIASRIYGTRHAILDRPARADQSRGDSVVPDGQSSVFVFPNPTSGEIIVRSNQKDSSGAIFEMFTPLGQLLLRRELFAGTTGPQSAMIDLGDIPTGSYLARLRGASGTLMQLVLKK